MMISKQGRMEWSFLFSLLLRMQPRYSLALHSSSVPTHRAFEHGDITQVYQPRQRACRQEHSNSRRPLTLADFLSNVPVTTRMAAIRSFDFSSAVEWERFYQEEQVSNHIDNKNKEDDTRDNEGLNLEWHSLVPMSTLVNLVSAASLEASSSAATTTTRAEEARSSLSSVTTAEDCNLLLMIGCGTSNLPQYMLNRYPKWRIVLLDSSQTCIDILKERYRENKEFSFICGDVANMSGLLQEEEEEDVANKKTTISDEDATISAPTPTVLVDCVYDKGLLDALLCGEGWNGPVATLLEQVAAVLKPGGSYVLVSYRLPPSTQEFLMEQGSLWGLQWDFSFRPRVTVNDDNDVKGEEEGVDDYCRRVQISRALLLPKCEPI